MTSPLSDPALAPGTHSIVWATGNDAVRFLNDLISQRVDDLVEGQARRSFLLTPKGSLAHLLWVFRTDRGLGMLVEGDDGEDLRESLGRYRIRVDVELTTERAWIVVGPHEGPNVSWLGVERHVALAEPHELPTLSPDRYQRLRVAAGEPAWGVDVDDSTLPHETLLVESSVDFSKGCYLGQELVARVDSRGGNAARRLAHVLAEDGELSPGLSLLVSGDEKGVVTSAAGSVGLAMIHRSVANGSSLSTEEGNVVVHGINR